MKKYLIFLISLFSILLIDIKNVKAYNEEVSPILDLTNIAEFEFEQKWTDEQYQMALDWKNNYCQGYDHYIFTSTNGWIGSGNSSDNYLNMYCFNGNYNDIFFKISKYSSSSNYYTFQFLIEPYEQIDFRKGTIKDNSYIEQNNDGQLYKDNTSYGQINIKIISGNGSINSKTKFLIPYIETDLNVGKFSNGIVSYGKYVYNSIKYNDLIYNVGDKFIDFKNGSLNIPTSFDYEISEGSEKGKKLSLFFNNYNETDYAIINNYQSGEEIKILDLKTNNTKIFDNISQDNTYQIKIYDIDNNVILERNIDIQEQLLLTNKRYIYIANLNNDGLNSYKVGFFNTKDDDKCFYHLKDEEEVEIDCNNKVGVVQSPNKNTYAENYIKDKNGDIVVRKNVNLNYLKNLPQFKFESYYDDNENKQTLKVIVDNLKENDLIYYSYDNENWLLIETKRITYLDFYYSTNLYFKVERNSEIVSEAYFDLVYNSYENSSDNNNIGNSNFSFKDLLDSFKQFASNKNNTLNLGTNTYNRLKNSKLGLFLTILIVGSFIILIVKSIKR